MLLIYTSWFVINNTVQQFPLLFVLSRNAPSGNLKRDLPAISFWIMLSLLAPSQCKGQSVSLLHVIFLLVLSQGGKKAFGVHYYVKGILTILILSLI